MKLFNYVLRYINMNRNKLIELVNSRGDLNVTFDELNGDKVVILTDGKGFTVFSEADGGAIMSDDNLNIAKSKFIEAMKIFKTIEPMISEIYFK